MPAVPLVLGSWLVRLSVLACLIAPRLAAAQMLEAPLTVTNGVLGAEQLATGRDGSVLQVAMPDGAGIVTRRFFGGLANPSTAVSLAAQGVSTGLTALPHGGFAAVWRETGEGFTVSVVTQRLSSAGVPIGTAVPTGPFVDIVGYPGIGPAGDGFVIAFREGVSIVGQRFDATGTPFGDRFTVGQENGIPTVRIAAVPGGFLVVWGAQGDIHARLYAADATPLSALFTVAEFELTGLAVNPAGTLVAVVGVPHSGDPDPARMFLRFFAPDGSMVSAEQLIAPREQGVRPDVASDASGHFLAVSGPGIRARAYDGTGIAFGPSVTLTIGNVGTNEAVKTVGRRDGGFFVMRAAGTQNKTYVGLVTLCAPGSAICGDGVLAPTCEVCDDGAGNSDGTPDACRTDCHASHCGDGTTDGDEGCDDGNAANCDGCDELCELEAGTTCGDGVLAPPGCREQCDDANAGAGDGCSATCKVERIVGGGKLETDCYATWRIDNPSNDPRFEKRGGVNPRQRCRDNDPACDFDGGMAGSCTFHLAVCVNNDVPTGCVEERLQSWSIVTPSSKQALTRPVLAAVRDALTAAVVPSVVGSSDPNACSPNAEVVLPLRGGPGAYKANKLTLKTRAPIYSGAVDGDKMQLRCDP